MLYPVFVSVNVDFGTDISVAPTVLTGNPPTYALPSDKENFKSASDSNPAIGEILNEFTT